jgi:hypothetical protein
MSRSKGYIRETHDYNHSLDLQVIEDTAPAFFSTQKRPDRSDNFAHFGTWELWEPMHDLGYVPVQVMQSGARDASNLIYAGVLTRWRSVTDLGSSAPEIFEIITVNADNGTRSFKFLPGYLRSICTNGCVFGTFMHTLTIQHRRTWLDDAVEQVTRLTRNSVRVMEVIDDYKRIEIEPDVQLQIAEYVHQERFGSREVPFTAQTLLVPIDRDRRDMNILYSVGQDIQRHVMRGGDTVEGAAGRRASTTRPVHAVRDYVRVNSAVSDAMETIRRKTLGIPLDAVIVEGTLV